MLTAHTVIIRNKADNSIISTNAFASETEAQIFARNAGTGEGYSVEVAAI